jgi:ABC-type sugar transport system ATPase subunit
VHIGGVSADFVLPATELGDPLAGRLGQVAQLGIRPEALTVAASASAASGWQAGIDVIEHLGDTVLIYASVAGVEQPVSLKLSAEDGAPWQVGMTVKLHPKAGALHLFDAHGQRLGAI